MVTITEQAGTETFPLHDRCNQLLGAAELSPIWQPPEASAEVQELAAEVRLLADQSPIPRSDHQNALDQLGKEVLRNLFEYFKCAERGTETSYPFRAGAAAREKVGNCIGVSEGIYGILAKVGLGSQAVIYWEDRHASNGLVSGGEFLTLDGCEDQSEFHTLYLRPADKKALWLATNDGFVTHFTKPLLGKHRTVRTKPITSLHDIRIDHDRIERLVMAGPVAVMAFCGAVAQERVDDPRSVKIREVLRAFTPQL